ncbi:MAG: putative rane protein [Phycisphaerales bacterium]|nr:putative rane protein [Phycisphaerales bacterium]
MGSQSGMDLRPGSANPPGDDTRVAPRAPSPDRNRFRGWLGVIKQAAEDWMEDNAMRLAASLAFYTMLSLAPLLVISIKVVGAIFGENAAKEQVQIYVREWMGDRAASAVADMIGPFARPGAGVMATTISAIILIVSASSVFGELQDALNTVWEVKPRPDRRIWHIIKERFFSYVLVLGTCFLLLVSLIISAALSALTRSFDGDPKSILWETINFTLSIAVITVLFAFIFKYLPDVKIRWSDVWMGAAVTGVLFTVGKLVLGWYLGRASTTSVYGAAGSLIALLLWVYYSAQILFFGAEITQAYAHQTRPRVVPTENAVKVTQEERAQKGMPGKERLHAAAGVPPPKARGDGG